MKSKKGDFMKKLVMAACITLWATTAFASTSETIFGTWVTEEGKAKVEIFQCNEKVCGKLIWLKEPLYTIAKEGPVGQHKLDDNNPNAALKSRPRVGLQFLEGLAKTGDNEWGNGTVYDVENGKTYKCKIKMPNPNRLDVRGFIGISLIGRSTTWTR